ncbi:MAG: hypothetical protein KBA66_17555 [Leptospiraceae bacterium]|nr:hypothetical protein [Leptospiraceae bacterium]
MGRTVMPYSRAVDAANERLAEFRRGLRKDDREIFDELMRYAKTQIQAGVMASSPNPFDSMSLIMHIQLAKQVKALLAEVETLKKEK